MFADEAKDDAFMYVDIKEPTKLFNIPAISQIHHLYMCGENIKNLL